MPGINWANIGTGAINNLVGAGMGLLLEGHNDKRQLEQQKKLQEMQMWGNKEMMNYSMQQQMEMWRNTNYGAQMEQIQNAGLNPALLYGKGGAGGTTTGSPSGNIQGATAPQGGMEIMNMMMAKAQMGLIQAQTEKTKAETTKTAGVDTTLGETQIASLTQGIQNQKAIQALTEVQTGIASIEEHIAGKTQNAQIALVMNELQYATRTLKTLQNEGAISDATVKDKIAMVKQQLALSYLEGYLKNTQIENIKQETAASIEKIKLAIHENMRQWDKLSLETKDQTLRQTASIEDMPSEIKDMLQALGLGFIFGKVGQGTPTTIKGFHQR